jgi:prophage tail gpP-like protein
VSHFHEAIVTHGGETILTGFILSQKFISEPKKTLVEIGGYAKPGVWEDCDIPTSSFPLQSDGLSLLQICQKLANPFHLKVEVDSIAKKDSTKSIQQKADKAIPKSTAKSSENIKSYLTRLATQQKVVLTHNELGSVVLTEAKTNIEPLFHIDMGNMPGTKVTMHFSGQQIHSHITVIKEASTEGGNAGEFTIRNPYCPVAYVYRPKVITQSSGDDISIEEYAKQQLALELKGITLTIETDRWQINGKLIKPNNIVTVYAPEIFIYKKTKWFIEGVDLTGNEKETTAVITCVLPCVYDGSTPENIFVNPHDNLPRF